MQCPIDQTTLAMTERQGIEIDYCPSCRGVWLDRGELDKLIAEGGKDSPSNYRSEDRPPDDRPQPQFDQQRSSHSDDQSYKYGKKRKKESFLENLFDF